jgi:opacity protein-like surface antigen
MKERLKTLGFLRGLSPLIMLVFIMTGAARAAHPLITDDAGTQGKGKVQLEFFGEYSHEKEDGTTTETTVSPAIPIVSYGLTDSVDFVFWTNYQHIRTSDEDGTARARGITDTTVDVKWRFFEKDGLGLALKPGITLPTGSSTKGLGTGKVGYHIYFIASKEVKPWVLHANLGYTGNENTSGDRAELWHASFATMLDLSKKLKLVGNAGVERNPDIDGSNNSGFLLGGFIYSVTENLDIDFGIRGRRAGGMTEYALPAGVTWRF